MTRAVLDTSALLAYLNDETGAEQVAAVVGDSLMSTVNFAEVITKLVERGGSLQRARTVLDVFDLDVVDFDRSLAEATGALAARTKSRGLSLGDRACLALAAREGVPAFTSDRTWANLDAGVEVRVIR